MGAFAVLLLLFFAIPLVEIYVLLQVGAGVGVLPTVGLVVFTAVLGAILIRAQSFTTVMEVRTRLAAGEIPAVAILEGAVLLVAGALLLTPGFVTDTLGFLGLVPPLRRHLIRRGIEGRMRSQSGVYVHHRPRSRPTGEGERTGGTRGRIIDGEYRHED